MRVTAWNNRMRKLSNGIGCSPKTFEVEWEGSYSPTRLKSSYDLFSIGIVSYCVSLIIL